VIHDRINEIEKSLLRKGYTEDQIDQYLESQNFTPEEADITTLPRAIGTELGTRFYIGKSFSVGMAAWYMYLQEELIFVGDEGTTEISGETRRIGLDVEARFQFTHWLWADIDFNLSDGRYIDEPDGENYIPLAPRMMSQGGINMQHPKGFEGSLRYRYIADRPANEDNTVVALGSTVLNLMLGYRTGKWNFFAYLENIFNTEWNEAQFDTESRLIWEAGPVSELHYTPGNPINLSLGVSVEF